MKSDLAASPAQGRLLPAEKNYPLALLQALRRPPVLYFRGNLDLLEIPQKLAVVGSRKLTVDNQRFLKIILEPIRQTSLVIVSGLALGLDALAHTIALKNRLPTIAVVGSSVEEREIYPATNQRLAQNIIEAQGLLLSPFAPGTPVMKHNFPARNQIIAALSSAVLVASAAKKSGALITAREAFDYGRDVLVIPGSITDPLYEGANELLQQGAWPILSADDLRLYFNFTENACQPSFDLTPPETRALELLIPGPLWPDELAAHLRFSGAELNRLITQLEIKKLLNRLSDGRLARR